MMSFVQPTKPAAVGKLFRVIGYILGAIATAMAVAQMVSFEEFVAALRGYGVAGERGSVALAVMLIALEVFSVPFLFRLTLSPLARLLSALCVVLAPCAWVILSFMALQGEATASNAGLFGGFLEMQLTTLILSLHVIWLATVGFAFGPMGGQRAVNLKS